MNERIKELINESTSFKEGDTEGKYDIEVFDKEKFAELIVRECAEFVSNDRQNDEYGVFVSNRIKEHFGVEE
jgi:hypothetical protein